MYIRSLVEKCASGWGWKVFVFEKVVFSSGWAMLVCNKELVGASVNVKLSDVEVGTLLSPRYLQIFVGRLLNAYIMNAETLISSEFSIGKEVSSTLSPEKLYIVLAMEIDQFSL